MSFALTELDRRLSNLIRFGTIAQADYASAKVRVKVAGPLDTPVLTDWLPWMTQRAGGDISWHAPEVGEQVVILSPSGELNQGVVLTGLFQTAHPQPVNTPEKQHTLYKDGAVIEYDRQAHHLKAVLPTGATVELISTGGVAITGDVTVTGNINASGEITDHTRSMQGDRNIYNGHTHSDPQSGSVAATGQTQ